jgi:hypothetical protein
MGMVGRELLRWRGSHHLECQYQFTRQLDFTRSAQVGGLPSAGLSTTMNDLPQDNIDKLHAREEQLRFESMAIISAVENLRDHWGLVHDAMNAIYAFSHDHHHGSDDELTLQFLGIRLFNAAAASIKLALSGYYQKAFVHLRDILETYFLIDYLRSNPAQIAIWKNADNRTLKREFGPARIREALDKRDGYTSQQRKSFYDLVSQYASHATYRGFHLTTRDGLGQIGPFIDKDKLQAWLEEMAKRFGHAAICLLADFEGRDDKLEVTRAHYLDVMNAWGRKYYSPTFPSSPRT